MAVIQISITLDEATLKRLRTHQMESGNFSRSSVIDEMINKGLNQVNLKESDNKMN